MGLSFAHAPVAAVEMRLLTPYGKVLVAVNRTPGLAEGGIVSVGSAAIEMLVSQASAVELARRKACELGEGSSVPATLVEEPAMPWEDGISAICCLGLFVLHKETDGLH